MNIFPKWYLSVTSLIFVLYLSTAGYYFAGAQGVRFVPSGGQGINFTRQFDKQLFKIDEELAWSVTGKEFPSFSVVKYKKTWFPFSVSCGANASNGTFINSVDFHKDDFVYVKFPYIMDLDVANLKTKQTFHVEAKDPGSNGKLDPLTLPIYKEHNLNFSPENAVTTEWIEKNFSRLSTQNESCLTFTIAYFIFLIPLGLLGVFFFVKNVLLKY